MKILFLVLVFLLMMLCACNSSRCWHVNFTRFPIESQTSKNKERDKHPDSAFRDNGENGDPGFRLSGIQVPLNTGDVKPSTHQLQISYRTLTSSADVTNAAGSKLLKDCSIAQFATIDTSSKKVKANQYDRKGTGTPWYKTFLDVLMFIGLALGFMIMFGPYTLAGIGIWTAVYGLILILALINRGIRIWNKEHYEIPLRPYAIGAALLAVLSIFGLAYYLDDESGYLISLGIAAVPVILAFFSGIAIVLLLLGSLYCVALCSKR